MKALEDECTPEMIIDARNEAIDKIDEMLQENKNVVDEDLEKKIKKDIKKQTGWFTSTQRKKQIEENVRKNAEVQDSIKTLMDQFNDLSDDINDSALSNKDAEISAVEKENTPKESQPILPKDYIKFDFELVICALNFFVENEFEQKIVELSLVNFVASHQQSYNISRSIITLEDFKVKDMWSESEYYDCLIETKKPTEELSDSIKFEYPEEMLDKKRKYSQLPGRVNTPQALIILFETGSSELERFKAQPYDLTVRV